MTTIESSEFPRPGASQNQFREAMAEVGKNRPKGPGPATNKELVRLCDAIDKVLKIIGIDERQKHGLSSVESGKTFVGESSPRQKKKRETFLQVIERHRREEILNCAPQNPEVMKIFNSEEFGERWSEAIRERDRKAVESELHAKTVILTD